MGVCTTDDQTPRGRGYKLSKNQGNEEYKISEKNKRNLNSKKKSSNYNYKEQNKNIEISLNSKKTIIKTIGQIKGESISIKNNLNCIILIMDYSKSINIQKCQDCSIFLASCENDITVKDCQGLNLISASLNLNILNVKKSNFYSFVSKPSIIESSENINIGSFFVQYMELPEMFSKCKLNIWNNKWSCFEQKGENSNISYSNDAIKQNVVDIFMPVFPECYINIDQFQFLPSTYGKSIEINNNYINFLIILRQEDFQESEILKMLLPEEIENYKVKLISTLVVKDKSDILQKIIRKLETNKENNILINYLMRLNVKKEGIESLQSSQIRNITNNPSLNTINKSRLNEFDLSGNECLGNNNYKFLKKGDFLLLWFVNENNDFSDIYDYFNSYFEPLYIGKILKEHLNLDEIAFEKTLEQIFEF